VSGSEHLHAGTPELCAEQRRAADAAVVTARVVAPLEPTVVQPIPPAYAGAGSRALIQRGSPMLLDEAGVVPISTVHSGAITETGQLSASRRMPSKTAIDDTNRSYSGRCRRHASIGFTSACDSDRHASARYCGNDLNSIGLDRHCSHKACRIRRTSGCACHQQGRGTPSLQMTLAGTSFANPRSNYHPVRERASDGRPATTHARGSDREWVVQSVERPNRRHVRILR
jgi:hypothetical protein